MKKIILISVSILISILLLILLFSNQNDIYGTNVLDDIIYQSSLSSISYDYLKDLCTYLI